MTRTNPKLAPFQVVHIKRALARGEKQAYLAAFYRVSETCISAIKNGKTWAEIRHDS